VDDVPPPGSIRQQLGQLEEELSLGALQEDNLRYAAENQSLSARLAEAEDALGEVRASLARERAAAQTHGAPLRRWQVGALLCGLVALGLLVLVGAGFGERARLEGRIAEQQQNIATLQGAQQGTLAELARAREQVGSTSNEVGSLSERLTQLEAERDEFKRRIDVLETEKGLIIAERETLRKQSQERQKIIDARDARASGKMP
jgi:chromosome segregation ATPase